MRILFLSRWLPWPVNNGSKVRIYNLLRGLSEQHEITLLSFADQPGADANAPQLQALCQEVQVVPWQPFDPQRLDTRLGFLSWTPRSVWSTYSRELEQRIQHALSIHDYDLVIASQWEMASYCQVFQGKPALLEEVELGVHYERFARASTLRGRFRHGLTWFKHRRYLTQLLRSFRACTVVSEQEKVLLARIAPRDVDISVIPNCIRLNDYAIQATPQPNTLIFTGPFKYHANYEAMLWFLQEVYPRIQAQMPDIRLTITGDHANLPLPPATNVTLAGFVDDVRPLIANAWVSLAPLRVGGGTRLKILEAMALGAPAVATTKGAEGLEVRNEEHLLLADTPEVFAEAVIRLCQEPGLRQRLAANARQLIRQHYDWATLMPRFLDLVEQVSRAGKTGRVWNVCPG